jgi:hypothetical protein
MKWTRKLSGGNTGEHIKLPTLCLHFLIYLTFTLDGLVPNEELLVETG